jgi:hypothetical protein
MTVAKRRSAYVHWDIKTGSWLPVLRNKMGTRKEERF